jgi:Flp pilus assembly pilin Flp
MFPYRGGMMSAIRVLIRRIDTVIRVEAGAVATEYGLILTLIALAIVAGAAAFGASLLGLWERGPAEFPSS